MARIVNQEEHAGKRGEILDAAQQLVFAKGYERMTIQDILEQLQISKGAFYHYFDSKPAVLEALIERMQREGEQPLVDLVHDSNLSALEKIRRFFITIYELILTHKNIVVDMIRVWYTDGNAIIRQKVEPATLERRTPLMNEIIQQGIAEGVFTTAYPDHAGEIVLSLVQNMGSTHAKLLLSLDQESDEQRCIDAIVTTQAAYMDAVERVLSAPTNTLYRADADAVKTWIRALRAGNQ